jgi:hypothetical protein
MHTAIDKWVREHGFAGLSNGDDDTAGMVLDTDDKYINKTECQEYYVFAHMFLNEADLSINIIAHECVHAVMTYERNVTRFLGCYDGNDGTGEAAEERFAYTLGEFVDNVITACLEHKIKFHLSEKLEEDAPKKLQVKQ